MPKVWLLTKNFRSRIFQQKTVPEILEEVFDKQDISMEVQGTFEPRDYCVQYRESDFDFASRLMEEEGIYYYFKHTEDAHKMVIANTPQSHVAVAGSETINYEEVHAPPAKTSASAPGPRRKSCAPAKQTLRDHPSNCPMTTWKRWSRSRKPCRSAR